MVSKDAALDCRGFVTSVVCQDDVVPRASLANFEDLRKEVIATNWSEKLKAEVRRACRAFKTACSADV